MNKSRNAMARCRVLVGQHLPIRRELPTFFVIGAQKAGTTTLFAHVCAHPNVAPPIIKEIHFFEDPVNLARGVDWYLAHYPAKGSGVTGEATPSYYHPLVPQRVVERFPSARLVLLVRNPVDRAFSHYQRQLRRGKEQLTFEEALEREESRIAPDIEKLKSMPIWPAQALRTFAYQWQGFYIKHIQSWLRYFSRDKLLVLSSEAYFDNPNASMTEVFRFLGLDELNLPLPKVLNRGEYSARIKPDTRAMLADMYRQYNQELYEFVGCDYGWERQK